MLTVLFAFPNIYPLLLRNTYSPILNKNVCCLKVKENLVTFSAHDSVAKFTEQENYFVVDQVDIYMKKFM